VLAKSGYRVLAFDFSDHGSSGPANRAGGGIDREVVAALFVAAADDAPFAADAESLSAAVPEQSRSLEIVTGSDTGRAS
jgi:hypothetical protein